MKTGTLARLQVIILCAIALCLAHSQESKAQTSYSVDSNSVIYLKGTSPLHNWGMVAHSFTGDAKFSFLADNQLSSITGFSLKVPIHNLKSESRSIEKSAYKALREDQYKDIVFDFTSAQFKPSGMNNYLILLRGNMTIAGVTQVTTLKMNAAMNENGSISCSGSLPIYLSDYNIERPTYLLGTMRVGEVLVLTYNLQLVK
jgi:polyisoprenoid-binding protein YceI